MDIIQETLERVYLEGFDEQRIESILHSAELSKKHEKSNFGLGLALGTLLQVICIIKCQVWGTVIEIIFYCMRAKNFGGRPASADYRFKWEKTIWYFPVKPICGTVGPAGPGFSSDLKLHNYHKPTNGNKSSSTKNHYIAGLLIRRIIWICLCVRCSEVHGNTVDGGYVITHCVRSYRRGLT